MKKWGLFLGAALIAASGANAKDRDKAKDNGKAKVEAPAETEKPKALGEFVKEFQKSEGLFPLYRDLKTGEVFMEIAAEQIGREFIYFTYTENGPAETGHFRGNFRDNRIIVLNRKFNRIEVEAVNTSYYFDPDNALSRAADANIARAPIGSVKIAAESEDGTRILISADALLKGQALHQITPWQSPDDKPGANFALGELSDSKTQIADYRSYPENTDIRVEYVFDNPKPLRYGSADITDSRSVAILVQHSFLELPDAGFKPRLDDFRVGFFTNQTTDLTSADAAPYRDVINRWRLEKKYPDAALSDPVKPITFWIENTTPVELRGIIRNAALAWNVAFEAAGFTNAVEVQVQPDNADWHAGDLRYNVLRWTSSPNPPFGGYGPSFTNPRTGEILGADIMLEYIYLTNRMTQEQIFDTAGLPAQSPDAPSAPGHWDQDGRWCNFGSRLQAKLMAARAMLMARGTSEAEIKRLTEEELYYLVLHEIGHTLGLNHNMRSSSSVPLSALGSPTTPPTNSVMDYPATNIALPGQSQGQFAVTKPGAYDLWVIAFGYTPDEAARERILARSTEPALAFANDADDLRAPGVHIDPRVMIDDLSDDPIGWAAQQALLVDQTLAVLPERMLEAGESYQSLYNGYMILTGQRAAAANVASRWIGGVYNNRSVVGQSGAEQPFVPVPAKEQRRALDVLNRIAFAPDAFAAGESLLSRLQVQRRGFDAFGRNIDPRPHSRALNTQRSLLNHLMHPNILTRLTDSRRYGGDYPVSSYMRELTGVMFEADRITAVNTYRQNLQVEYLTRLIGIASGAGGGVEQTPGGPVPQPGFDYIARSAALASIARIKTIAAAPSTDEETRAHRAHLRSLIAAFERR
ncbi:zinc-dependent metalloprotease [uncultured Erythrobacter sp.]|uniref:zinc-dependent metalloprotease n=1 Tax=uncultured Erythrobacter sp. TaxID=263913 RepID=UPI00265A5287|nr:zinc-dependent metalloprotease [uncultured Erythrobacter sp.]